MTETRVLNVAAVATWLVCIAAVTALCLAHSHSAAAGSVPAAGYSSTLRPSVQGCWSEPSDVPEGTEKICGTVARHLVSA